MTWRWWRRRARRNGHDAEQRREQERKLAQAKAQTPAVERAADRLASLPPDELAKRVRAAMTVRRA